MRRSSFLLLFFTLSVSLTIATLIDAGLHNHQTPMTMQRQKRLVQELGLTDLALFTEARYTRHPTQADLHSAFQDHPLALEHFPSGSLLPPPRRLTR